MSHDPVKDLQALTDHACSRVTAAEIATFSRNLLRIMKTLLSYASNHVKAAEIAQAHDLARRVLENSLASDYHKANMHLLLSALSDKGDSAM